MLQVVVGNSSFESIRESMAQPLTKTQKKPKVTFVGRTQPISKSVAASFRELAAMVKDVDGSASKA